MNEKIKELARTAGAKVSEIDAGYGIITKTVLYDEDIKEFANLIVNECVETLGTYENTWTYEEQMTLLKKHFGIK